MSKKRKPSDAFSDDLQDDDERYFLRPDAVSQHLYCSVCQEVFIDPQRAPCGHSFCKKCICAWLKQSNTCPEDRKPVTKSQLHHDFILENIIGDQMVACPHRRHGCDFIGQLQLLSSHKKSCTYNPRNLPQFLREDLSKTGTQHQGILDTSSEELATPIKPSLKLRLFSAGAGQRELLCSMFDKENTETGGSSKR